MILPISVFGWLGKNLMKQHYQNHLNTFSHLLESHFYSHLNMEDIADADYTNTKRVKDFEIKKLGDYHDLYLQSNALLLADVFESLF